MIKKSNINSFNTSKCEAISIVSGKGGTGKTFIVACTAYALQNSGQRVCLIDTDFATQGLSLFILGRGAERGVSTLVEENSLYHMVQKWNESSGILPMPKKVDRIRDHGMRYQIILSNKQFYDRRLSLGVKKEAKLAQSILSESMGETSDLFRNNYRFLIRTLINKLVESDSFDYILIDTRGGFGELSLASVIFSDSFLIVTEPDFTSFHQLAKLLTNIDLMAQQENTKPYIRGVIVNKAIDGEEEKFRALLESQFGIEFGLSWPFPLDQDAIQFYKNQLIPYVSSPGSKFSYTTLNALTEIFDIVTVEWAEKSKNKWHNLLKNVETANQEQQKRIEAEENKMRILQEQAHKEIKKANLEEEKYQIKLDSLEIKIKEEKEQHKKAERETKELQNELKKAELGGIKKSNIQRYFLIMLSFLAIMLAIFSYITYKEKTLIQQELSDVMAQVKTQSIELIKIDITITSIPEGAIVFIDEEKIGITPLSTRMPLLLGTHQLKVRKKNYSTYSEEFATYDYPKGLYRDIKLRSVAKK